MRRARPFQVGLALALCALSAAFVLATPDTVRAASSPTITAVAPSQGSAAGGTVVTITGTDFQPGLSVYIANVPAPSVTWVSTTQLTLTTPRAISTIGGAANVVVVNSDGGATSQIGGFFYTAFERALAVTSVSGDRGPNSGGMLVTIFGDGFSAAAAVYFGSIPATSVNTLGASQMFVRPPPNVSGPVTVTIINPDGTRATLANGFTYTGPMNVTAVTPGGGPLAGGTTVSIKGDGFVRGASVQIGAAAATSVLVVNSTQIVAVTPAGTMGNARITVINPDGVPGVLGQGFTYGPITNSAVPVITTVAPASGPSLGGTQVMLAGTGFVGGAAVYFGGVLSPIVLWNGPSSVFARTPANVGGPVPVMIVNNDGATMTLANAFTYEGGNALAIQSVTPTSGSAAGGALVTINGSGFNAGSWVTFDGVPALSSTLVASTSMVATAPPGLVGAVTVAVTQIGGLTARLADGYTFTAASTTPLPAAPPVTPPPSGGGGGFLATPIFSAGGQALVIFGGGSVDQLEAAGSAAKATGVWVQDASGAYQLLVVSGPAFLKDQFKAKFPNALSANTVATLTR